jgi:Tfp pilus assembly protein PilV
MKLATRVLISALVTLMLCAAVTAQTLRSPQDPRNQAPAVGTGGPVGGPTGLFTVYDADTIRKGEFTFSIAYSNYDRDPGNVDLVVVPLSFNVGLNDHLELFFKTDGYRGIKVNNPTHLSSFYLPNSQLFFGATRLCTGPAIIQAPERVTGATLISGTVFRPAGPPCNVGGQPFRQFPFIGATGPNLGLTGNAIAPPYTSRIGAPFGGNGNFGGASNFPGMGSPVGSILPGVVLSTRTIPANLTFNTLTVPATFTVAPAYLPDAPFINRLYGESSFGDMVFGAKIRLSGPNDALGVALIPFYRWYPDKADDFSGFNQLQRGASPGGSIGDFGLIGAISGRLSQHANVSANLGYILNSNPKSEAMGDAVLLDRADEFLAGLGFDFPVNKHFQLIAEARSTMYVGGRTPNAFNNNPVDALGGVRIFPARWWGLGAAYRRHMNQQDQGHFNDTFPGNFRASDDPNGFIFQFWAGHRNARIPPHVNAVPVGSVSSSSAAIALPCPEGTSSDTCTPSASRSVDLTAGYTDADNDTLLYTWTVTGGKLTGDGRMVSWDLSGLQPGTYTANVSVVDGNGGTATGTASVTIAECTNCKAPTVCPTVSVSCPANVPQGDPITFTASVSGDASVTYNWTVSAGTISSGQGTSSISVDTTGIGGQSVTATVELGGLDPSCSRTASCTTSVETPPQACRKFDEYADLRFNDEKARLDNLAIQLQQDPGSQAYYVVFGSCDTEGAARSTRAVDYLVNNRGIDRGRITVIDGGCRETLTVELWICPAGAGAPTATNPATVSPCPACKVRPRPRARLRRGRR